MQHKLLPWNMVFLILMIASFSSWIGILYSTIRKHLKNFYIILCPSLLSHIIKIVQMIFNWFQIQQLIWYLCSLDLLELTKRAKQKCQTYFVLFRLHYKVICLLPLFRIIRKGATSLQVILFHGTYENSFKILNFQN